MCKNCPSFLNSRICSWKWFYLLEVFFHQYYDICTLLKFHICLFWCSYSPFSFHFVRRISWNTRSVLIKYDWRRWVIEFLSLCNKFVYKSTNEDILNQLKPLVKLMHSCLFLQTKLLNKYFLHVLITKWTYLGGWRNCFMFLLKMASWWLSHVVCSFPFYFSDLSSYNLIVTSFKVI